jgi:hypothetical protein
MFGGYSGGGFGRAMEMGMAMNLGANLVNGIFRWPRRDQVAASPTWPVHPRRRLRPCDTGRD